MDVFRVRKVRETTGTTTSSGTLDSLHQEMVQNIRSSQSKADELKEEKSKLQEELKTLEGMTEIESVVKYSKIESRIREIDKELEKTNPVEDYYMNSMDILIDYYGKKTGNAAPSLPVGSTNNFMKFFNISSTNPADTGMSKKQMFDEYTARMKISNNAEAGTLMTEHCNTCNIAREEITSEGILVCPKCGSEEYALVVSDFPSFRDPPKEWNNYTYKKINHLNEILNQFQAKESTIIPDEVMNEVILEIRKRRIVNIADLSEEDIRQILKKLGRSKYYEHRAHILSRLNGNPPPTITPEIEEKIRAMFQEIQAPFLLYCPNDRTNFLSYSYILYKFFELLELDEYKAFFPLLKSRDRLIAHDQIWKKICDYLRWEFIQSV